MSVFVLLAACGPAGFPSLPDLSTLSEPEDSAITAEDAGSEAAEDAGSELAEDAGSEVADAPSSINDVPNRPVLTYTIEQRRQIAQGLVRDRELARHARASDPRPERPKVVIDPPPKPAPRITDEQAADQPRVAAVEDIEPPALETGSVIERNAGSLNDLLKDIRRLFLDPFRDEAATLSANEEPSTSTDPLGQASTVPLDQVGGVASDQASSVAVPASPGLERFTDFVDDEIGLTPANGDIEQRLIARANLDDTELALIEPSAGAGSTDPAPDPSPLIGPADGDLLVDLSYPADNPDQQVAARRAVADMLERYDLVGFRLVSIGNSASPSLALERARAMARVLIKAGIPANRIELRAGTSGERVLLRAAAL